MLWKVSASSTWKKKKSPYLYTFVRQTCKHALSRSLVRHQRRNSLCANTAANFRTIVTVNAVTSSGEHSPQDANRTNQDLGAAARAGLSYTCLPNHVTSGFPFNRYNLHASLFPFWKTGRPISCHVWSKKLWSLLLSACAISAPTWRSQRCGVYKMTGEAVCLLAWYWLRHRQLSAT